VVIEHNLDVLKTADWIVDLGPEGGDKGGFVIAEGTPEQLAVEPASATGHYLRRILEKKGRLNGAIKARRPAKASARSRVAV